MSQKLSRQLFPWNNILTTLSHHNEKPAKYLSTYLPHYCSIGLISPLKTPQTGINYAFMIYSPYPKNQKPITLWISLFLLNKVRMAERSKAPDSREILFASMKWAFWSSNEGVGSNPTSDKLFFSISDRLSLLNKHFKENLSNCTIGLTKKI